MVVVLLAPWPSHGTALMSRSEESTPISQFKVEFNPTCLFPYKSSSPRQQALGAFPGEEKTLFFSVIALG